MVNQIYALLVGIDRYANPRQAPHLRGCVADVEGTYHWLVTTLGVPEDNILLLTSRLDQSEPDDLRPTRANIISGWRTHLVQAGEGDQVFFNYSGHGSQARSVDPNEPDGLDETLVAQDSRTDDANGKPVYDLLDKELATLIQEVEGRGAQVSVFLDCCHSGHGTRSVESDVDSDDGPRVRQCMPDSRLRLHDSLVDGFDFSLLNGGTRSIPPAITHLLLAGCRDEELANEYRSPETLQWHGATTYFFHKALSSYRPGMTWAEVYNVVRRVHDVYPTQLPQLEGDGEREFLGGLVGQDSGEIDLEFQVRVTLSSAGDGKFKVGKVGPLSIVSIDNFPSFSVEVR